MVNTNPLSVSEKTMHYLYCSKCCNKFEFVKKTGKRLKYFSSPCCNAKTLKTYSVSCRTNTLFHLAKSDDGFVNILLIAYKFNNNIFISDKKVIMSGFCIETDSVLLLEEENLKNKFLISIRDYERIKC